MDKIRQTITLRGPNHYGSKVPPKELGELMRVLPDAVRSSVRMAFESRSSSRGKAPTWLRSAADVRFVRHLGDDETILVFESPRLGDAAAAIYQQQELWPTRPSPDDTGLDLLGDVIREVRGNNQDSDRFDRRLLRQIQRFGRSLDGTFQEMELAGNRLSVDRPIVIDAEVVRAAAALAQETPMPKQCRVVGTLDMIRDSTNAFAIKLQDGQEIRGLMAEGKVSTFAGWLAKPVLVLGKAVYRPSGRLLRVDANEVTLAGEVDRLFAQVPAPTPRRLDVRDILREQPHKRGVAAIYGMWPGHETDEQVAEALKEIDR